MKWLPVLFYLGIAGWQVGAHYDYFFPRDPLEKQALDLCFMANHRFDPRDRGAREACLKAATAPAPETYYQASLMQTGSAPRR